jgi:TonB family protein
MLRRILFLLLAAGMVRGAAAAPEVDGNRPELDAAGARLMDSLDAEPSGCPGLVVEYGSFHVAICGQVPKERRDADALKATIDELFPSDLPSVRPRALEWQRDGNRFKRASHLDGQALTVGFNRRSGKVALYYPPRLPSCLQDGPGENPKPSGGFLTASRIKGACPSPAFPRQARVDRVGGTVALEIALSADGRVTEICVQGVDRPGYGFEQAAIDAMGQCRYEPATLEDRPVASKFESWIVFELR